MALICTHLLGGQARLTIIAVTGTVGKTSTKDAIAAALSPFGRVRKSEKSFNSEIGVPLAILGAKNQWSNPLGWFLVLFRGFFFSFFKCLSGFLVLEVGTDKPGDIRSITKWLKPDVVVVTKLSRTPVHIENFSSVGELIAEKGALVESVRTGGTIILNVDDNDVLAYRALAPKGTRIISFGFGNTADVRGTNYEIIYEKNREVQFPAGFSLATNVSAVPLEIRGVLGKHFSYSLLAALATTASFGFDMKKAVGVFSRLAPGRMRLLEGMNNSLLIDDSYNSSPVAAREALETLSSLNVSGRKFAVLGDMLELGEFSEAEHKKILEFALTTAYSVFIIGERFSICSQSCLDAKGEKIRIFSDASAAGAALAKELRSGDVALIKGSQGIRMERAVEQVLANRAEAKNLLVRQEKEWLKKP